MAITQTMPTGAEAPVAVRHIEVADLHAALAEGWADFKEKRGDVLVVSFIYPILGLIVAGMAIDAHFVPLAFPICAGLSLLGPAVAVGFYELARRREAGLPSDWSHFFDGFRRHAGMGIATTTLLLALLFLLWLGTAWLLYAGLFGSVGDFRWPTMHGEAISLGAFVHRLFATREGWTLILLGNLLGAGFALLALALSAVSFPMLVDRPVDMFTAVGASLRAFAANPLVMLRWGVMVGALLVLGSIPFFIGLSVVLPVLGYATWHLYTRLVVR